MSVHEPPSSFTPMATPFFAQDAQPSPDMRWADCGHAELPGWQLGWAQIIGTRHPNLTEDSVAHARHPLGPGAPGDACGLALAVADGVGGGARGEVTSAALTRHCVAVPDPLLGQASALTQWMQLADAQVQVKLREVSAAPGAATLAAAWLLPATPNSGVAHGHILRVGDARVYLSDGQKLHALTQDQTYASVGELPPEGATPDDPARMVGTGYMGEPELVPIQMPVDHTLLLCSDGLHRGLGAPRMADVLHAVGNQLQDGAMQLAQAARLAGSQDDITVLLAKAVAGPDGQPHATTPLWRHVFKRVFA